MLTLILLIAVIMSILQVGLAISRLPINCRKGGGKEGREKGKGEGESGGVNPRVENMHQLLSKNWTNSQKELDKHKLHCRAAVGQPRNAKGQAESC